MKNYDLSASAKSIRLMAATAFLGMSAIFFSCGDDDTATATYTPTATSFNLLRQAAIDSRKQHFEILPDAGGVSFTSAKGVEVYIPTACLRKNGQPVSGMIEIEFMELFSKADMILTNKTTTSTEPDGTVHLLQSGGEFFISASQDGIRLTLDCEMYLSYDSDLTGNDLDYDMTLWRDITNDNLTTADVSWTPTSSDTTGTLSWEGSFYFASLLHFGWANCDKYGDAANPTDVVATVPNGFTQNNCTVFFTDDNSLSLMGLMAQQDSGQFQGFHANLPVGLSGELIFISEINGEYQYQIKSISVAPGQTFDFVHSELLRGTEAQLIQAIEAVQN